MCIINNKVNFLWYSFYSKQRVSFCSYYYFFLKIKLSKLYFPAPNKPKIKKPPAIDISFINISCCISSEKLLWKITAAIMVNPLINNAVNRVKKPKTIANPPPNSRSITKGDTPRPKGRGFFSDMYFCLIRT